MVLVGIQEHATPRLLGEVSQLVALCGSLQEATTLLAERGTPLDLKTVRSVAYRTARAARLGQQCDQVPVKGSVQGRRVVVSVDGGRVRLRQTCHTRTPKGRATYATDWREPKLLLIYVVDAQGKPDRTFAPVIDGTLGDADVIFMWLRYYLTQLAVSEADSLLFVADGARWLWSRWQTLVADMGLPTGIVSELLDFYHAVQHLHLLVDQRKRWSAAERRAWTARQRRRLLQGEVDEFLAALRLAFPRMSKAVRTEVDYFTTNRTRLAYAQMKTAPLPLGSGALESTIRRVVNLRLKGAGTFWLRESAEAVLYLRAFFKAGRWAELLAWAFFPRLLAPALNC